MLAELPIFTGMQRVGAGKKVTVKFWALMSVFAFTVAGAFVWNYQSYSALADAVENLSNPDENLELINATFRDVIEAENHIQSFILTDDTAAGNRYNKITLEINNQLVALRSRLSDDSAQVRRLDTLQAIFDLKNHYLMQLLRMRRMRATLLSSDQALSNLVTQVSDTFSIDKQFLRRDILKGYTFPVEKEEILVTPDEFKGVRGFLRKLFGVNKTMIDTIRTVANDTVYSYQVAIDTSIVREYFVDSTLAAVKDVLARIVKKEVKLQEQLNKTELVMLNQNKVLVSNMRAIIEALKVQEQLQAARNSNETRAVLFASTKRMLFIGFGGFAIAAGLVFLIVRDVTRAERYRAELQRQKERAEKLARVKEEFLSGMSHEIRTPLHNITGFSAMLSETELSQKQREYVGIIEKSNNWLLELLNGVLDGSRIEAGKVQLDKAAFSIPDLIHQAKQVFMFPAMQKNLSIDLQISDLLYHRHVEGDPTRLKQVVSNLLSNAIKFTDEGRILVAADAREETGVLNVTVCVTDTGRGIDPERIDSIFDRFAQDRPTDVNVYNGMGLGLFIVRGIVQAMGGTISARNNDDRGATFEVRMVLPIATPDDNRGTPPQPAPAISRSHAVIVEDDTWNRHLIKELLSRRCARVSDFDSGEEALDYIRKNTGNIDVVFTDINLPGMSGDNFLDRVKEFNDSIPVVAVTAHAGVDEIRRLKDKGFERVIRKPFGPEDIDDVLHDCLGPRLKTAPSNTSPIPDGVDLDLSDIMSFASNDHSAFVALIHELISHNEIQLAEYREYVRQGDARSLAELCHKMKTTYGYLRLNDITESLAAIESWGRSGLESKALVAAAQLDPRLVTALEALKQVALESHAPR